MNLCEVLGSRGENYISPALIKTLCNIFFSERPSKAIIDDLEAQKADQTSL